MKRPVPPRWSLRRALLLWILLPTAAIVALNTFSLYRQALEAADTAYDRTLLATAKSLGELLEVTAGEGGPQVRSNVPYSALEAFEADNRSRLYYKVSGFKGERVAGFDDIPAWRGDLPRQNVYAALVHFYDGRYRDEAVRVAVLLQPVAGEAGQGMATIQVAETLELRRTLAGQILRDTLWRQAALIALIGIVVTIAVQTATRPVRAISASLLIRPENDLTPIDSTAAPGELLPLLHATNHLMRRLSHLLEHQKRFVRDTAHQLRTPLAVLKAQVQSAQRGDVDAAQALREIDHTLARANELANQMLALAKVEQLRHQDDAPVIDWAEVVRAVALDLAALIADRHLDFTLEMPQGLPHAGVAAERPIGVRAHEWALRELTRNLLHNAIKFAPPDSALSMQMSVNEQEAELRITDEGPGIDDELRERLFQPFSAGVHSSAPGNGLGAGSGLGLAICHEIASNLGGRIILINREVRGLLTVVRLPLAR